MAAIVDNDLQHANDNESTCSDSGSVIDGPVNEEHHGFPGVGMCRLEEEEEEHIRLKHWLYMSIGSPARCCHVVAVHRNTHSTPTGLARLGAFQLHLNAMKDKRNGNPNVRHGWFGTSKDGVHQIINDGFGFCGMRDNIGSFGFGLHISSENSATDSVLSSTVDGDELRYVVFCRVILGNVEEVLPGSRQFHPSSEKFDSGVDNKLSPKKYIVWYPNVNTHILPLYVLSVKVDFRPRGLQEPVERPSSPWMPFNALISVLSRSLAPSTMRLIRRHHTDFMERKISRKQLILRIRQLAGDKLLISAVKYFRDKQIKMRSRSALRNGTKLYSTVDSKYTKALDFLHGSESQMGGLQ